MDLSINIHGRVDYLTYMNKSSLAWLCATIISVIVEGVLFKDGDITLWGDSSWGLWVVKVPTSYYSFNMLIAVVV